METLIPCQGCSRKDFAASSIWFVCSGCGVRLCQNCLSQSTSGFKCDQCDFGRMEGPQAAG